MIDVVVARYKEDVSWVDRLPAHCRVTIYNKGDRATIVKTRMAKIVDLPNIGREAHTYLHHIFKMQADPFLGTHTVFCQGDPFAHCPDFIERISGELMGTIFGSLGHHCECDANGMPQHLLPIADTFRTLFPKKPCPPRFKFVVGAQFVVSNAYLAKSDIYEGLDPEEWNPYIRATQLVQDRGADLRGQDNTGLTWGAHILERLWSYLIIGDEAR